MNSTWDMLIWGPAVGHSWRYLAGSYRNLELWVCEAEHRYRLCAGGGGGAGQQEWDQNTISRSTPFKQRKWAHKWDIKGRVWEGQRGGGRWGAGCFPEWGVTHVHSLVKDRQPGNQDGGWHSKCSFSHEVGTEARLQMLRSDRLAFPDFRTWLRWGGDL